MIPEEHEHARRIGRAEALRAALIVLAAAGYEEAAAWLHSDAGEAELQAEMARIRTIK